MRHVSLPTSTSYASSLSSRRPLPSRGQLHIARDAVPAAERTSLIPETLKELAEDAETRALHEKVQSPGGQQELTAKEKRLRQRSLESLNLPSFAQMSKEKGVSAWKRKPTTILQVNIGLYCNQACSHCHVESSPLRKETLSRENADHILRLLSPASPGAPPPVATLDLTGGAPELAPQFRYLVEGATARGVSVIDRCNLTVLLEPGQEDLVPFLASHKVRVVASLPCYSEANVDKQRGRGVFERSIEGLKMLNAAGYGRPGTGLQLDLVYNPGGAFLAPAQGKLEVAYKDELGKAYGITFNSLFCLNNMPIKRFADWLVKNEKMDAYMDLLVKNFNPSAAEGVMCRDLISVNWDGRVYDCDFNQQLDLPVLQSDGAALTVASLRSLEEMTGRGIRLDSHCYGCTAGAGSSCQGATA